MSDAEAVEAINDCVDGNLDREASARQVSGKINLRDVGCMSEYLPRQKVFRSSQFHTHHLRSNLGIASVLDLRETGHECKKASRKMAELRPGVMASRVRNANKYITHQATRCPNCEQKVALENVDGMFPRMYHIDLTGVFLKLKIFGAVPTSIKLQTAYRLVTLQDYKAVMSEAVADNDIIGYGKLYIMYLEESKHQFRQVFQVLADPDNFPILIHCVHGKDRTGLVVMLILLVCGASSEHVLDDYIISADNVKNFKGSQEDANIKLCEALRTERVLSVERKYMAQALKHLMDKYETVDEYLETCGVTAHDLVMVRKVLATTQSDSEEMQEQADREPSATLLLDDT